MAGSISRVIFILCCFVTSEQQNILKKDAFDSVPQLIMSAGYPVEKHRVTTTDGYILQLHRIPAGKRTARKTFSAKGKKTVLIGHGLLGSSSDFVMMGPDRSLAYSLADEGYDVWLANLRGTIYSSHQNYTKNNPKFWEFSFHEHGKYDLPASIDKVLSVTGVSKIMYIGYSMGTTTFFVMASERPEYNDKIISFVALAPAVYFANIKPIAEWLLKSLKILDQLRVQGIQYLNVRQDVREMIIQSMCYTQKPQDNICARIIYMFVGNDEEQYNQDITALFLARFQPASFRQFEHFGKIAMTDVFTSWEDGLWGSVRKYKLSNVRVPVTLLYGENDQLTEKSQVLRLAEELNATGVLEDVRPASSWSKFNHLDFVFAKDVASIFNKPLLTTIKSLFYKYG
ncbi:lipase 3-like [Vanessa tameamea]|uniref:Lipase n=1 Tax=Vanessa tameamea TaxID=334116 RepID=A0A8B8HZM1_VANTA|nr:lipase 3-like [Vanessa tameamea]